MRDLPAFFSSVGKSRSRRQAFVVSEMPHVRAIFEQLVLWRRRKIFTSVHDHAQLFGREPAKRELVHAQWAINNILH
jgi:hypothetical protein